MGSTMAVNRVLWIVTGVLTAVAAAAGVLFPGMYLDVVDERILPGVFTQDILALVAAVLLLVFALVAGVEQIRSRIVIAGILGFLFYAYGIYAMEQIYTLLYPLYLAILGLSFYSLIYSMITLDYSAVAGMRLPRPVRIVGAAYAIFVSLMFTFIWVAALIPLIREGYRQEYTFSIYVIDLSFIMPAMAVAGIMALRDRPLGIVGVPALFILGFGILSPLALGEVLKPVMYDRELIPEEFLLYLVLSVVFIVLTVVYLAALRRPRDP